MTTDAPTVTAETLQRLLEAFNTHDIDAVMAFFAEDCVLEMPRGPDPWGRRLRGRERVREGLEGRFAGHPRYSVRRGPALGRRRSWLL